MCACLCVAFRSSTPATKMLSSAMTRSLDFLVSLFTDFTPIFGGPAGDEDAVSPTERRTSRNQDNWLLARLQATFSPNSSPHRRRCNSDASASHILCLSLDYQLYATRTNSPCLLLSRLITARPPASRPKAPEARVRTEGRAPQPPTRWTRT